MEFHFTNANLTGIPREFHANSTRIPRKFDANSTGRSGIPAGGIRPITREFSCSLLANIDAIAEAVALPPRQHRRRAAALCRAVLCRCGAALCCHNGPHATDLPTDLNFSMASSSCYAEHNRARCACPLNRTKPPKSTQSMYWCVCWL